MKSLNKYIEEKLIINKNLNSETDIIENRFSLIKIDMFPCDSRTFYKKIKKTYLNKINYNTNKYAPTVAIKKLISSLPLNFLDENKFSNYEASVLIINNKDELFNEIFSDVNTFKLICYKNKDNKQMAIFEFYLYTDTRFTFLNGTATAEILY